MNRLMLRNDIACLERCNKQNNKKNTLHLLYVRYRYSTRVSKVPFDNYVFHMHRNLKAPPHATLPYTHQQRVFKFKYSSIMTFNIYLTAGNVGQMSIKISLNRTHNRVSSKHTTFTTNKTINNQN